MSWPSFRKNLYNNGLQKISFNKAKKQSEPFLFKTKGVIWATPVIDKNRNVYFGSADRYFYALNPKGKLIWKYKIKNVLDSLIDSAAIITKDNKKVVIPGGDGYLHAVDIKTGKKIWEFEASHATKEQIKSGKLVNSFEGNVVQGPGKNLYAGSDNGFMYCVSEKGKELWRLKTGMMVWSAPAFSKQNKWMAFGSLDGYLYLLNYETGKLLDKFFTGEIKSSPCYMLEKNLLLVGTSGNKLLAFEIVDEKLQKKWLVKTKGEIYSSPACYKGNIYFGSADGFFYSVSYKGKINWKYNTYSVILSSASIIENKAVILGAANGKIYALDFRGNRIWSFKTVSSTLKANLDSSPAISQNGDIFIGSYNGNLYCLPANYCLKNKKDKRCQFGGNKDNPPLPKNILNLEDKNCNLSKEITVGLSEPVRIKLTAFKNNHYLSSAAINPFGLSIKIQPDINFKYYVSSNGKYINIFPDKFWETGINYKIKISGSYYIKKNYLSDKFKWFFLPKIQQTLKFNTVKIKTAKKLFSKSNKFSVENMFLYQPLNINSLVAAALDAQKYITEFSSTKNKSIIKIFPAHKDNGKFKKESDEHRNMSFMAKFKQNYFTAEAKNKTISAMGGTIPCKKIIVSGEIAGKKIIGTMFVIINGLQLKGNAAKYRFPLSLVNKICDHKLNITVMAGFKGRLINKSKLTKNKKYNKAKVDR